MQVQLSGNKVDVTPALRKRVDSKLARIDRVFDNVTSLNVVLSVDKLGHRAEATMAPAGGHSLHAQATGADMYASIDLLFEKLDGQLRRHKEKLTNHHQAQGREQRYN